MRKGAEAPFFLTNFEVRGLLKSILIIGGGTAGWLAANHLGKKFKNTLTQVTLIESPNIPTIGVGEGTVPMMRQTLAHFGIDEGVFFQRCDAAFKQGIKFENWMSPLNNNPHYYYHPFDYFAEDERFVKAWLNSESKQKFSDFVGFQSKLCELNKAPKKATDPQYQSTSSYAYHLDAGKFSELLKDNAIKQFNVKYIPADVSEIEIDLDGGIKSIKTDKGIFESDLFVDCTGFRSLLLGQSLEVKFIDKSDILFADKALAVQVPHFNNEILPYTRSTAQTAGWIWDISLNSRKGIGHVFSSNHTTVDEAYLDLEKYVNQNLDKYSVRSIDMKVGYREKAWSKNCVGLGLSQGFVEPLEATGLLVFDVTAKMLADILPESAQAFEVASKQFNNIVTNMWNKVIDFIKLHYCISDREDSTFWIDNKNHDSIPESLLEKLERYKFQHPNQYDFAGKFDVFNLDNYLYVLYGMSFNTIKNVSTYKDTEFKSYLSRFEKYKTEVVLAMPEHKYLLDQINKYGISKI